jgi:hypothetical protein
MLEGTKAVSGPGGTAPYVQGTGQTGRQIASDVASAENQGRTNTANNIPGIISSGGGLVDALLKALNGSKQGPEGVLARRGPR